MRYNAALVKMAQQNPGAWNQFSNYMSGEFKPQTAPGQKEGWSWNNVYQDPDWRSAGAGFGVGAAGGAALGGLLGGRRGAAVGGLLGGPLMALLSYYTSKHGGMPGVRNWLGGLGAKTPEAVTPATPATPSALTPTAAVGSTLPAPVEDEIFAPTS